MNSQEKKQLNGDVDYDPGEGADGGDYVEGTEDGWVEV